jgi:hypothetical protein
MLGQVSRRIDQLKEGNLYITPRVLTVRKKLLLLAWSLRDERKRCRGSSQCFAWIPAKSMRE